MVAAGSGSSSGKFGALGKSLRELRSSRGLKQEDVANALRVATPTYSSWERGRTEPDTSRILELARFFDITVGRLLRSEPRPLRIGTWFTGDSRNLPEKDLFHNTEATN